MKGIATFIILSLFVFSKTIGQTTMRLANPSFEGIPKHSTLPFGWGECKVGDASAPDTQPGSWGVTQAAKEGSTYISLVVRENETTEAISQKLPINLLPTKAYRFSVYACHSEIFKGRQDPNDGALLGDNSKPAKLRVWGGNALCSKQELLGETDLISNLRWLMYSFELNPKAELSYITFEAYYQTPIVNYYNGHLLLDHISDITIVDKDQPKKDTVVETKILKDLDVNKIKEGQTIRIDKLYFAADSSKINPNSFLVLDEVYKFLNENPDVVIEIGGHTNNIPPDDYCNKLSMNRAKAVSDYLNVKGIPASRILYKGYGKKSPVASNASPDGRRQNQRVEIKILSVKKNIK